MLNDLNSRALLVSITIHTFHPLRADKEALARAAAALTMDTSQDTYLQALLPPSSMEAVKTAARRVRSTVDEFTVPWIASNRMLPSHRLFDFQAAFVEARNGFDTAVAELSANYMALVQQEKQRRGDLFRAELYPPTAEEFRERFSIEFSLMPVPNLDDFRLTISDNVIDQIRQETLDHWRKRFDQIATNWADDIKRRWKQLEDGMTQRRWDGFKAKADSILGFDFMDTSHPELYALAKHIMAMPMMSQPTVDAMEGIDVLRQHLSTI